MPFNEDIEAALPALRRYALTLVDRRHEADDLVQDCVERAFRGPRPATGSVRPWLFAILHNLGVSRWRQRRRQGRAVPDAEHAVPPAQEWRLVARDLTRAFAALAPEHRQVLLMVAVDGMEYRDAAAVLGVPVGTVMSRLSRARDALRARMADGGPSRLRRVK